MPVMLAFIAEDLNSWIRIALNVIALAVVGHIPRNIQAKPVVDCLPYQEIEITSCERGNAAMVTQIVIGFCLVQRGHGIEPNGRLPDCRCPIFPATNASLLKARWRDIF